MNTLVRTMRQINNRKVGENGDTTYSSTMDALCDLFAFGGAYRSRSDEDCIFLFKKAFEDSRTYALKCLFYLRDCRGGQGERRFFRVIINWLAKEHPNIMERNMEHIPYFGRWDDLYSLIDTPLESKMFQFIYNQLINIDANCKTPSLLAKWLKSENTSSIASRKLGTKTRLALGLSSKEYRKLLSSLRGKIKVVEKLMSQGRWEEIEFDKLPSQAGLKYKNAFARNDLIKEKYKAFISDKKTKVNAGTLYPCDVVAKARQFRIDHYSWKGNSITGSLDLPERLAINKYWENLSDYFHNAVFNGVAVVDTSGSMDYGWKQQKIAPIDVAIALGMYCAEKCNKKSPWYQNYITFSRTARLIPVEGVDFVDKVKRIYDTNLCENTNIESVFDLILRLAVENQIPQKEMPENIIIISDMEFDTASTCEYESRQYESVMEKCMKKYIDCGYELPHIIFWNVNARNDTIAMPGNERVTFVSGYSPVIFEQIMSGKTGRELMLDKLDSDRYNMIY